MYVFVGANCVRPQTPPTKPNAVGAAIGRLQTPTNHAVHRRDDHCGRP